jgi:hypothetical protein
VAAGKAHERLAVVAKIHAKSMINQSVGLSYMEGLDWIVLDAIFFGAADPTCLYTVISNTPIVWSQVCLNHVLNHGYLGCFI